MEPTVLAGPIEFSPAEIALILAVLAAAFVVVTAPGWVVLAVVLGRRPAPGATSGRRWAAAVAGALVGLALSLGVASLVNLAFSWAFGLVAAWLACWGLAALLRPRRPSPLETFATGPSGEGWGR